jgi:hypothetical protein
MHFQNTKRLQGKYHHHELHYWICVVQETWGHPLIFLFFYMVFFLSFLLNFIWFRCWLNWTIIELVFGYLKVDNSYFLKFIFNIDISK